jgi:hypothetical protein
MSSNFLRPLSLTLLFTALACQSEKVAPPLSGERSVAPLAEQRSSLTGLDCEDSGRYELEGVGGALFNTLAVDTAVLPLSRVGAVLANDQIHMLRMAQEAGLEIRNKHVPAFVIFGSGGNVVQVHSGGFYQCERLEDCQGYLTGVVARYRLDGTLFTDRPEFHGSFQGHAYQVIGGARFQEVSEDYAIKITRWRVRPDADLEPAKLLRHLWKKSARAEACRRGTLAQAFLLWSEEEQVVAEVTIGVKIDPPPGDPTPYFIATLGALAAQPVLDPILDSLPLDRVPPPVTDTYLVLTYWPSAFAPSRWPNSASTTPGGPLPEPFCGDGSCNSTVAHAESNSSCPADCAPGCGDGICSPGETPDNCAIDCPPL